METGMIIIVYGDIDKILGVSLRNIDSRNL